MIQGSFFEAFSAYGRLDKCQDPLLKLNEAVDWELFRIQLQQVRKNQNAGRKAFDVVMMFKILILQSLYNLSDDAMEYMIRDRLSFMRFLGFSMLDRIPDAKTIWLFREQLTKLDLVKPLFEKFGTYLSENGFKAESGQLVDATIIQTPIQHNTKEENETLKNGEKPEWSDAKAAQKDTDARWTKKGDKSFFGYKDHINADEEHKIIREYEVTPANTHDSQVFEEIVQIPEPIQQETESNATSECASNENGAAGELVKPKVYADSAYYAARLILFLVLNGLEPKICAKGTRNHDLTEEEKARNRECSRTRCRVEHIFGSMYQKAHDRVLRGIGIARARTKIGLSNLAYNVTRYSYLWSLKGV